MRIDVSDIVKVDGAALDVEFDGVLEGVASAQEPFLFDKPVVFKGKLVNVGGVLKLEGKLKTGYLAKCYRCLKDIDAKMDIAVKEEFLDGKTAAGDEVYTYEGNFIEIDKVLKDNIILNLPMKQICSEECRGLCPQCGNDLNTGICSCREESVDPRLDALKNFFNN